MPLLHIRLLRPFLLLLLLISIPSIGWSQCSPFAYNPITGRLDCAPASSGMTDPTTTTGDLIYRSAGGTTRLAIGTAGQYLGVVAGVPGWTSGPLLPGMGGTGVANTATLTMGSANINFATLGTGIVKNTTTTGALTNAASTDIVGLFTGCSGTQYLGADGACHTASAGATSTSALTDFQVVKTSGTVETINGACSASAPCNIQYGTTVYSFTSAGTVTISGTSNTGSVYWWLDSTGALNAGHNTTTTLTGSGVTISTGITAFPADTKPLWVTTFTANVWDTIAGSMDKRAFASTPPALTAGANVTITKTGTGITIASTASGNPLQGYVGQAAGVTLVGVGDNTVETITSTAALGNPGCWTIEWGLQHTTGVATLRYSLKIGATTTVWNTSGDVTVWHGYARFCATGANAEQLDFEPGIYNLGTGGAVSFFQPAVLHATATESTSTTLAVSVMAADTGGAGGQVVTPIYLRVAQ